jgi:hypothetical protein
MVVLHEGHIETGGFVKRFLVEALEKKTTRVAEDPWLNKQNVRDRQRRNGNQNTFSFKT